MKKLIVLLALLAGCGHGPVHHPIYTGPGPVSYETLAQIHRGLQDAAFYRRFILIEDEAQHGYTGPQGSARARREHD